MTKLKDFTYIAVLFYVVLMFVQDAFWAAVHP